MRSWSLDNAAASRAGLKWTLDFIASLFTSYPTFALKNSFGLAFVRMLSFILLPACPTFCSGGRHQPLRLLLPVTEATRGELADPKLKLRRACSTSDILRLSSPTKADVSTLLSSSVTPSSFPHIFPSLILNYTAFWRSACRSRSQQKAALLSRAQKLNRSTQAAVAAPAGCCRIISSIFSFIFFAVGSALCVPTIQV